MKARGQNLFFDEIVEALRFELELLGVATSESYVFDEMDEDRVYALVAPHEWFALNNGVEVDDAWLARTIMISAEQPHTHFFDKNVELAAKAGAVAAAEPSAPAAPAAIDSLDVCVQCSLRPEPLGQNVLQYLAAGKPTIVSGEGGPSEWVRDGENGLVFEPRDVEALASAIRALVDDLPLRRRLAAAAAATPALLSDQQVGERIFAVAERSVSA